MRWMTALTMMALLCTGLAIAQTGTSTNSGNSLQLPGLKAELQAGMSMDQLKKALLPEINVAGRTSEGIGIYNSEVPLDDGVYALTLGLENDRLVMIGLASLDSSGTATDSRLRAWFDKHVAALHSPVHKTDTDSRGNPRNIWTARGVRWTRGSSASGSSRKVPMYMVEFTPSSH